MDVIHREGAEGKMGKLYRVCWIAGMEYRKWLTGKHMLILLFSVLFLGEYVFSDMLRVAQMAGLRMHFLEPMDLVMSYSFYIMVIPLVVTVELSGFPDKSAGNVFVAVRSGRVVWLFGELLFGILVGITCLAVFFAASLAWLWGRAGMYGAESSWDSWSPFMTEVYERFPEIYVQNDRVFLESGTMAHGTPAGVALACAGLLLLYFMVMVQVLCLFRFLGRQRMGLFFNMGITVFGAVAVSNLDKAKWLFPLTHAIFGEHFDHFFARPIVPLPDSVLYFFLLNGGLLAGNLYLVKRCQIADGN